MPKLKQDILERIIIKKKQIVAERKLRVELELVAEKAKRMTTSRSFKTSIQNSIEQHGIAIIAELKKASPSKGLLCSHYKPAELAIDYEQHGATCLSILTDEDFFLGNDQDLAIARANTSLPLLRKDFIVDCYQIYESKLLGADCILLIAAALSYEELIKFHQVASELNIDTLIEIANEEELSQALDTDAKLIGINNRNLHDFTVDLRNTLTLRQLIGSDRIAVCESGIRNRSDIESMLAENVKAFLIGEALITAENPGKKLQALLGMS